MVPPPLAQNPNPSQAPAGGLGQLARGGDGVILDGSGGDLQVLIQWDRWTSGHDGNCGVADCGTCTASATNNRWWTACDQIGNAP